MNLSDNIVRYDMDYYLLIKNVYVKITLNITLSPCLSIEILLHLYHIFSWYYI